MAPEPAQKKSIQRRKKAAVLGVAGVVGIVAAATMANWTDEEFAGAEMTAGKFDLEIATTAKGQKPGDGDWVSSTTVDSFEDLEVMAGPWGPGDYGTSDVHVRLEPGTTHDARLIGSRAVDAEFWDITGPDSVDETLSEGDVAIFPVTVAMNENAPSQVQGEVGTVVWKFQADQLPNEPATGEGEG